MFADVYRGKRVLVTGNTGFKGSWLTLWLLTLGARVTGLAKDIPTQPSLFEVLDLEKKIDQIWVDLRNLQDVQKCFRRVEPDFVFHLAAQALVSRSYQEPLETITSNVLGTAHVLECLRALDHTCSAVLITSDKVYDNVEWVWGYRENDRLGGRDPYSASKGAAELIIRAYEASFLRAAEKPRIAVARAGNVVGGGDWSANRVVVDCVRAWSAGRPAVIRSPRATRPWQHVLEPLSGYLMVGMCLANGNLSSGEAFNFGPGAEEDRTVEELVSELAKAWGFDPPSAAYKVAEGSRFHEAGLLRLNCDKAMAKLRWRPTLRFSTMVQKVADWYRIYYSKSEDMTAVTLDQLSSYCTQAATGKLEWAR